MTDAKITTVEVGAADLMVTEIESHDALKSAGFGESVRTVTDLGPGAENTTYTSAYVYEATREMEAKYDNDVGAFVGDFLSGRTEVNYDL